MMAGRSRNKARESVTSVIARMVAVDDGEDAGSAGTAAATSTPVGPQGVHLTISNNNSPSTNLIPPPMNLTHASEPSPVQDGALMPSLTASTTLENSSPTKQEGSTGSLQPAQAVLSVQGAAVAEVTIQENSCKSREFLLTPKPSPSRDIPSVGEEEPLVTGQASTNSTAMGQRDKVCSVVWCVMHGTRLWIDNCR